MIVADEFKVHVAKSHAFKAYKGGDAAFITNGISNNGVQGYVSPIKSDKVFDFVGICISAFCEATVQKPPFLGRGNGGSGIIVLEPINNLSTNDLLYIASYINNSVRWRFSYGRMVSKERISRIKILKRLQKTKYTNVLLPLPHRKKTKAININLKYGMFKITSLFDLRSGDFHNASKLLEGNIPLVSCGNKNNGVIRFVSLPQNKIYNNCLTISYNGQPMTTKYHPYKFAAKDDIAVCIPKTDLRISTIVFIQFILNMETWRFSYGRKCFREKLSYTYLNLPITKNGNLDENAMEEIITNTTYWDYLKDTYSEGVVLRKDIDNP